MHDDQAKGAEDEKQKQENAAGQVVAPTFNLANFLQLTLAPGTYAQAQLCSASVQIELVATCLHICLID
jgi:hypothetical protein